MSKIALLVGAHYEEKDNQLSQVPVNLGLMRDMLAKRGFDVYMLTNKIQGFRDYAATVGTAYKKATVFIKTPGVFVFYFTGHGSFSINEDGIGVNLMQLTDKEVLPQDSLLIEGSPFGTYVHIYETCHAGTSPPTPYLIPNDSSTTLLTDSRSRAENVTLAAASWDSISYGDITGSAFTKALCSFVNANPDISYSQLSQKLRGAEIPTSKPGSSTKVKDGSGIFIRYDCEPSVRFLDPIKISTRDQLNSGLWDRLFSLSEKQ